MSLPHSFFTGRQGGLAEEDVSSIIKDFTWTATLSGASQQQTKTHSSSGNTEGMCVTNDGTHLLIFDYGSTLIYKYELGTPGNPAGPVSTYRGTLFNVFEYGNNARGGRFNEDGTLLYVATDTGLLVLNYNTSTNTASVAAYQPWGSWSNNKIGNPRGLLYNPKPGGHEVLIQDATDIAFHGFPVSGSAIDTSTQTTYDFTSIFDSPYVNDGTYFTSALIVNSGNNVIVGNQNGWIVMYEMSTPYDFSTIVSTPVNYLTDNLGGSEDQNTRDMYINDSGQLFSSYSTTHKVTRWS
jgi:formylmethanofuran dehydrogenase subunit D